MERTSWVPGIRAGAASLVAALALVCLPGTTIAGGSSAAAAEPSAAPSAPLTRGVGFDRPDGAAQVRALQRRLQELGQRPGPVDGLFGPLTEAAVERFQLAQGLDADGIVGPQTRRALRDASRPPITSGAGYGQRGGSPRVRVVQRRLRQLGQRPGPIDGLFGPKTEAAVERFQRTSHLVADGVVGSHTLGALAGAGHAGGGSPARPAGNARRPEQPTRAQAPPAGGTKARRPTTSRGLSRAAGRQRATRAHRRQPAGAREANHPLPWRLLAVLLLGLALVALLAALALGGVRRRVAAPRAEATVGVIRLRLSRPHATVRSYKLLARRQRQGRSALGGFVSRQRRSPRLQAERPGGGQHAAERPAHIGGGRSDTPVLGYVSVASPAAAVGGQEFRRQSKIITGECKRRGLRVLELVREHEPHSGKGLGRPGLGYAFKRISTGEAQGLVVSELSRLSRSAAELGRILAWFKRTRRG